MLSPLNRAHDQRSAGWHQERAGFATGSKFADAIGFRKDGKGELKARADYRLQLVVERLTGQPKEGGFYSAAMDFGTKTEPEARTAYEIATSRLVEEVGFMQHPEIEWCGLSVDGLVGEDGTIEIKCPNSETHIRTILMRSQALAKLLLGDAAVFNSEPILMPEEYYPQVQGGLWVTGRQWCDFISYDPRFPKELRLYVQRIERDEAYITKLSTGLVKFLDEVEEAVTQILGVNAASADVAAQVVDAFTAAAEVRIQAAPVVA